MHSEVCIIAIMRSLPLMKLWIHNKSINKTNGDGKYMCVFLNDILIPLLMPLVIPSILLLCFIRNNRNRKKYEILAYIQHHDRSNDELKLYSSLIVTTKFKSFLDKYGTKYVNCYSKDINGETTIYYSLNDLGNRFVNKNKLKYGRKQETSILYKIGQNSLVAKVILIICFGVNLIVAYIKLINLVLGE